ELPCRGSPIHALRSPKRKDSYEGHAQCRQSQSPPRRPFKPVDPEVVEPGAGVSGVNPGKHRGRKIDRRARLAYLLRQLAQPLSASHGLAAHIALLCVALHAESTWKV